MTDKIKEEGCNNCEGCCSNKGMPKGEQANKGESMMRSIGVLTIICIACAVLLGAGYVLTKGKIENAVEDELKQKLEVVFAADSFQEEDGRYVAYVDGEMVGYVMQSSAQGYSSVIQVLVGIDNNGKITGISILDQSETPGLGTKIEDESFTSQFKGLISGDIALSKEGGRIDSITGATISSRAVVEAVKASFNK